VKKVTGKVAGDKKAKMWRRVYKESACRNEKKGMREEYLSTST
jgi:hypothetical protein